MDSRILIFLSLLLAFCSPALGQNSSGNGEKSTGTGSGVKTETVSGASPEFKSSVRLPDMIVDGSELVKDTVVRLPLFVGENVVIGGFSPFAPELNPVHTPWINDISYSGRLASWNGFNFTGYGTYSEHPFLMIQRSAGMGVSRRFGGLYLNAKATAANYAFMPLGTVTQFGFSADLTYTLSSMSSITLFGSAYNVNPYVGMQAYPFVNTSRYGGYVTVTGDNVGVDLGAERYFDPMRGQWQTAPIVTPKVRIADHFWISVPVGGAIKNGIDRMNERNHPHGPVPVPEQRKKH